MKKPILFNHPYLLVPLYFAPVLIALLLGGAIPAVLTGNVVLLVFAIYLLIYKKYV